MKNLSNLAAICSVAILGSAVNIEAASYQFIASSDTVTWDTAGSRNNIYWNQNSPWSGTPAAGHPDSGDTLDLAAGSTAILRLTNGGTDVFKTYSVNQLSAGAAAGSNVQLINGASSTRANLDVGTLSLSSGAMLSIYRNNNSARILVSATNASIGAGSTLYIGATAASSSAQNTLDGFVVSGSTTVDGNLYSHFQNYRATGNFNFGDLKVNSTGTVMLMYGISIAADAPPTLIEYGARSLSGSGNIFVTDIVPNSHANEVQLNLVSAEATDANFSGTLSNTPVAVAPLSTSLAVTVSGSGRQTFSGRNTYTGATTISAGTLILSGSGSINSSSGIALSGGKLIQNSTTALVAPITWTAGGVGGNGTITGNLAAIGSGAKHLTPGDLLGTLSVTGDLTLDAFTSVSFDLRGTAFGADYGVLSVGNELALNNAVLNVSIDYAASLNDQFEIMNFGTLAGTFDGLDDNEVFQSDSYSLRINYNNNAILLTVVAVPEPGTSLLLGVSGILLGAIVQRRRLHRK